MSRTTAEHGRITAPQVRDKPPIPFQHALLKIPHLAIHQVATDEHGNDRKFRYLSEGFEWFSGNSVEAILRDAELAYDCVAPEDRLRLLRAEAAAASSGDALDVHIRFEKNDGGLRWCRILSAPRRQDDGSLIWDGVHIDVTSDIESQRQLRDLNGLLDLRLDSRTIELDRARDSLTNMERLTRVGSWVYDPTQPTLEWSESVYEMFGLSPDSSPPTFTEFMGGLPDEQRNLIKEMIETENFERTWEYKLTVNRPDGSTRTCWAQARLERREGSSKPILFGICKDVTDRDSAEATAEQSHKMEAIGQLTSGLAHDFNNLLAITIANLDLIKERTKEGGKVSALCDHALSAALRGADLTQQLLSLSRNESVQPRLVDLNDLISRFGSLLDSTVGHGTRLITDLADDISLVNIDPVQFESALLNLIINARDSMPSGGVLTVETSLHVAREGTGPDLFLEPGPYVLTKVSDTGTGMPQDVIDRAFEPFYTTKKIGEGTGLGLSMISAFAKRSGGNVEIVSRVGIGSSVLLYLPCSAAGKDSNTSSGGHRYDSGNTNLTVLLVDDNAGVRDVTKLLLTDLGYTVIAADSGISALSFLRHLKADILLTDVVMPNMTGLELALAATEMCPELRVVYTIGFGDAALLSGSQFHLLPKPFTKLDLSLKLQEAVNLPRLIDLPAKFSAEPRARVKVPGTRKTGKTPSAR